MAKTTLGIKDWLKRAAQWETKQLRAAACRDIEDGMSQVFDVGQLKVTESNIIRRAVRRELIKMQIDGGPGFNLDLNSS